ncbi:MAG TPA: tyrosine--tRNA ligase, partial [Methanoregulaceae archaeon]|nr:tyrosine--tRNA ligase [Methanoregulaceae archaeon]
YLPERGYRPPVCLHTPILNGLDGKKMSSSQGNYISVAESEESIKRKLQKAFCPPGVGENPVLGVLQHHVFPRQGRLEVRRPEKFGGDRVFETYEELEGAYAAGEVHPADLKRAAGEAMVELLRPVREYLG